MLQSNAVTENKIDEQETEENKSDPELPDISDKSEQMIFKKVNKPNSVENTLNNHRRCILS